MISLDVQFDRYSLLARQRPALFMLFPILIAAAAVFPSLRSWWAALIACAGTCGVSVALSEFTQGAGKRLEAALIKSWDGLPSVAMLRHRDKRIDSITKTRYKVFLQDSPAGLRFPSAAEEEADPGVADEVYRSATRWLLSQTRDIKRYALLFQQNISYGFRRNMLGLRPWGFGASVVALTAVGTVAAYQVIVGGPVDSARVVAILVAGGEFGFWLIAVRPEWVRIAANAYALELLGACDSLPAAVKCSRGAEDQRLATDDRRFR
ncbi:MAG: hypothetical protein ACREU3_03990 [Steroidobacteraceae bacterium]